VAWNWKKTKPICLAFGETSKTIQEGVRKRKRIGKRVKKKFLHPRREERCRRIKHTMRKLESKVMQWYSKKNLYLRNG
jgi:hypothetical protein